MMNDKVSRLGVLFIIVGFFMLCVSYVIDVSRGKCEAQRNYLKLLLWLCFFPQMIQGPICRYNDTAEQLYTGHDYDYRRVKFGVQRMLVHLVRDAWRNEIKVERVQYLEK